MWRCWLLILLLGTGCIGLRSEQPTDSSSAPAADSSISDIAAVADDATTIAADRLGPARLGATLGEMKAEVERTFGDAVTFVPTPNFMVDLGAIAVNLGDETLFYVLHFGSEPLRDSEPVALLLTTNPRFKTAAGVGPGTLLREAESAYGGAVLAHSTENEMRESVQFADFDSASVVFRTNGFAEGEAPTLAGLYDGPVEGAFYETTQYRGDATIRAVMLDGNRLEASRRPARGEADSERTVSKPRSSGSPASGSPDGKTPGDRRTPGEKADSSVSYAEADRQLNQTYQAVINALEPEAQEKLVTAQRSWISFRDAECLLQPLIGTAREGCLIAMTRDRTAQLNQLLTDEALRVPDALLAGLGTVEVANGGGETVNCDDPQGTPAVNYCTFLGYEREDDRLNQVYQAIQSGPSTEATESLVDAQLAWIDFRDAHCLSEVHEAYGGTGYNAYYAACQAQLTQQRANALLNYSNFL